MRTGWQGQGAVGFEQVEEGQGGSHQHEGLVGIDLAEERGEVEPVFPEEESIRVVVPEMTEHVAEGGLGRFCRGRGKEQGREAGKASVLPGPGNRKLVE